MGCDRCENAMYYFTSDYKSIIDKIGTNSKRQASLVKCKLCGTYWEEEQRLSHPLTEQEAYAFYPNLLNK